MMFFAQSTPSPAEVASFLSVVFYLIGILTAGMVLYRQFRPADVPPQPFVVSAHEKLATADQLKEVHGRIKRERDEINAQMSQHTSELKQIREKLDDDISRLNDRIDRLPERIITLLRETKGLI